MGNKRNNLTAPIALLYFQGAINSKGAFPALAIICVKGVFSFWALPVVSLHREVQGWSLWSQSQYCGHFILSASEKFQRRCAMKKHPEESSVSPKEMLETHLKRLQLITRLLLLSSAFNGFSLTADDVQSLCSFLLDYIGKVQKTLLEVK